MATRNHISACFPTLLARPEDTVSGGIGRPASATIEKRVVPFAINGVCEIELAHWEISRPLCHILSGGRTPRHGVQGDRTRHLHSKWRRRDAPVLPALASAARSSSTRSWAAFASSRRARSADALRHWANINPVAHFLVGTLLAVRPGGNRAATFRDIERDVAHHIRPFYRCAVSWMD